MTICGPTSHDYQPTASKKEIAMATTFTQPDERFYKTLARIGFDESVKMIG